MRSQFLSSKQIQIQGFVSYQFGEIVNTGIADPLSRSRTVQAEGTFQTRFLPDSSDGIFNGVEDGCC